jgi:hypothetical protein
MYVNSLTIVKQAVLPVAHATVLTIVKQAVLPVAHAAFVQVVRGRDELAHVGSRLVLL